jgi:hypothetical protein
MAAPRPVRFAFELMRTPTRRRNNTLRTLREPAGPGCLLGPADLPPYWIALGLRQETVVKFQIVVPGVFGVPSDL